MAGDTVLLLPGSYSLGGATLTVGAITVQPRDSGTRPTIDGTGGTVVAVGAGGTLRDVRITNTNAPGGAASLSLLGPNVVAERIAVETTSSVSGQRACSVVDATLRDSSCLLTMSNPAVQGVALGETTSTGGSHNANLVNVTAWGRASGGPLVTGLLGSTTAPAVQVTVLARNVIAHGTGGGAADVVAATSTNTASATVTMTNSNFASSATSGTGTMSVSAPSSATNQIGAPSLVDPNNGDFHQLGTSPTVDAGATDAQLGTQDPDFGGRNQRSSPDIGADEFPGTATVAATSPVSPANDNAPKVKGTAPSGSLVHVYPNAACTGPAAGTGTSAQFTGDGITVGLAGDSTAQLSARAADPGGGPESECTEALAYVEDSTPPAAPAIGGFTPASPANENSPELIGTSEPGSTVSLFTTPTCTGGPLASGSAVLFGSPGLTISVADNSTTTVRATATDAAGNTSLCSFPTTYLEDSRAPSISITLKPKAKVKTKKPKAPFLVGFTVDESATLACALDGAPAVACSSPFLGKVKKGKHTVVITATDPLGNVSTETVAWTVKHKSSP
jgi:hypothetical protein